MRRKTIIAFAILFFVTGATQAQTRRYVRIIYGDDECDVERQKAHFYGCGGNFEDAYTSWNAASDDLQLMIDLSQPGDEIWVAEGVYTPRYRAELPHEVSHDEQSLFERFEYSCRWEATGESAFVLKSGVQIYGGFGGWETNLSQRDLRLDCHPTVLSGVLPNGDRTYHVVISVDCDENTVLDGFTITGGRADKNDIYSDNYMNVNGGKILNNCGGGIYNENSTMRFANLIVENNYASINAGGIYECNGSSSLITTSIIRNNRAGFGGGIYFLYGYDTQTPSRSVLNTVLIIRNTADYRGGGVYASASEPTIVNATINSNTTIGQSGGGGIYNANDNCTDLISTIFIFNTVVWGNDAPPREEDPYDNRSEIFRSENTNIEYDFCLIGGSGGSENWNWNLGYDRGNNMDTYPWFSGQDFNVAGSCPNNGMDFYNIRSNSPLIDMGSVDYYLNEGRGDPDGLDLEGFPRINNQIDIGAYEFWEEW